MGTHRGLSTGAQAWVSAGKALGTNHESEARLELAVKAPVGDADRVAAGLVEREGERARDDTGLQVEAGDGESAATVRA